MMKRSREYEIRTIDQYGDAIDIVDTFPSTRGGYKLAVEAMNQYLEGEAVAVVLELTTFISDPSGQGLKDIDNGDVIDYIGDTDALKEGGWIK